MLNRVTFTGVDNKTNVEDLVEFKKEFPFVEFGVLVSKNNTNTNVNNRYPNLSVINSLRNKNLNLACHLCGSIARNIVQKNEWQGVYDLLGDTFDIFDRFQLNVSGVHEFSTEVIFPKNKQFLIQLKEDISLYNFYKYKFDNVFGFQDNSGGMGVFQDDWRVEDKYFGYAGGLSEKNVVSVLDKLSNIAYNDFWVDMESSVRTDEWFDLEKCRKVAVLCKDFIK